MAESDGMAGLTTTSTSSAEEGRRTGLGEGEREDGAEERTWLGDWELIGG